MRRNEPLAIVGRDRLTITFSAARLVCRAPLMRNITVLTGIILANLIWANAQAAPIQLATPTDEPHQAAQQFDSFAACIAYWKIVGQCLPPGIDTKGRITTSPIARAAPVGSCATPRTARAKCTALGDFPTGDRRSQDRSDIHVDREQLPERGERGSNLPGQVCGIVQRRCGVEERVKSDSAPEAIARIRCCDGDRLCGSAKSIDEYVLNANGDQRVRTPLASRDRKLRSVLTRPRGRF